MDLVAEERKLWLDGAEAFRAVMSDDGVLVVPMPNGIKGREAALTMLAAAPKPADVIFSDLVTTEIAPGAKALSYRADADFGGAKLSVFNTSIWRDQGGAPRLALHQQTPCPESEL